MLFSFRVLRSGFLVMLLSTGVTYAQATSTFNGRILDQADAVLPGVTVTATTTIDGLIPQPVSRCRSTRHVGTTRSSLTCERPSSFHLVETEGLGSSLNASTFSTPSTTGTPITATGAVRRSGSLRGTYRA